MALGPRLDLRQSQALTMTPQLQQAIKLLALSNLEIETFIGEALEANPLLEAGEISMERGTSPDEAREEAPPDPTADQLIERGHGEADSPLDIDVGALDRDRDTGDWAASGSGGSGEEGPGIDERAGQAAAIERADDDGRSGFRRVAPVRFVRHAFKVAVQTRGGDVDDAMVLGVDDDRCSHERDSTIAGGFAHFERRPRCRRREGEPQQ